MLDGNNVVNIAHPTPQEIRNMTENVRREDSSTGNPAKTGLRLGFIRS
jgi:hypothetical protein